MNYVPCIFSLLPCWLDVPGISFRFHGAGNDVSHVRFPSSVCPRHVVRAGSAVVFVHMFEVYPHQVAGLVVVFQRAIAIWIRVKNTACGQGKNASGFRAVSTCVPRGEKLVARILKSGPLILKSEPLIFSLLRGVCNRLKNSSRLRGGECVFYYLFAVCRGAGVLLYTKRSSGFVKLRAYARRIALCTAEGVAGYDETVREGR